MATVLQVLECIREGDSEGLRKLGDLSSIINQTIPTTCPDGYFSLLFAAADRKSEIVKILLETDGICVDLGTMNIEKSFGNDYETPLYNALREKNMEIAKILIRAGAEIDSSRSFIDIDVDKLKEEALQ